MILITISYLVQGLVMLKNVSIKNLIGSAATLALALGITSCGAPQQATTSPNANSTKKPKVVATSSVLCDVTQEIAQDTVELKCLIPAGSDPHVYEPKPDHRKAIEQAQLILYNGHDFEPDLIKLIKATKNTTPKVAVNEIAVPKPLKGEEHKHEKAGEKAEAGHDHGEADPHVWHDAQNGIKIVETVGDKLAKIAPSHAAKYTSNAEKMTSELKQLDSWIKAQIATIPANQRKLITTHDALGYFSNAYGLPVEGALQGISTEEKPTAGNIKDLVKEIKTAGVPTIFAETSINPKLIEAVAKEANVKVSQREIFADGLGEKGSEADTYKKMMIANTQTIVEGLGGKFTPFAAK
jgi:manganese/iron transport system substrate-binding protein